MKRFFFLLLGCILFFTGCSAAPVHTENLGAHAYSMKTLDGLFFSLNDELYLISGTESPEGSFSQVFIYNTAQDAVIFSQNLENSKSMTAFCETPEDIFFATISGKTGCDLYAWNKSRNEIRTCAHMEEKGIYALTWDGADTIFAATSSAPSLYTYRMQRDSIDLLCKDFTSEKTVRSLSYVNGKCYLGIGKPNPI